MHNYRTNGQRRYGIPFEGIIRLGIKRSIKDDDNDNNNNDNDDDDEVIWTGHLSDSEQCIIQWFPARVTQYS
jgi:hypothetical protein